MKKSFIAKYHSDSEEDFQEQIKESEILRSQYEVQDSASSLVDVEDGAEDIQRQSFIKISFLYLDFSWGVSLSLTMSSFQYSINQLVFLLLYMLPFI